MAGFQFVHVETYGRASPKKAARVRWTIRDVIAEAAREAGACPHVAEPQPPVLLFGDAPADVERAVLAAAEATRDAAGRRHRRDAQLLLAGVASFPMRLKGASDAERQAYEAWERDTVAWLRATYGDHRLRSVLRHTDEAFGHIHWFAVPDLAVGERMDALHPGRLAIGEAKAAGVAGKGELDRLYRAAMRKFQDDYHAAVGIRHGLTRSGPNRRRLTRAEWHAERAAAERAAGMLQRASEATHREAELELAIQRLALDVADEGLRRRQAERERNDWCEAAKRLGDALAVEQQARRAAEDALVVERRRVEGLERMLEEAREIAGKIAAQAAAIVLALLDPFRYVMPTQCPDWLNPRDWIAAVARGRPGGSRSRISGPQELQTSRSAPTRER